MGLLDRFSDFGQVDGSEENSNTADMEIIAGGTKALFVLNKFEWDEHPDTGYKKIRGECKCVESVDGVYDDRVVFLNLDLYQEDDEGNPTKKSFKAANQAIRILQIAGVQPDSELSDECLAQAVDTILGLTIDIYEITDKDTGDYNVGNWVRAIDPSKIGKTPFEQKNGTKMPKGEGNGGGRGGRGGNGGGKGGQRDLGLDDDEPAEKAADTGTSKKVTGW